MASYYELGYVLTKEEAENGLKIAGTYKSLGKRGLVENIILAVFALVFLVSFIINRQAMEIVMFSVCIVVIAVLNIFPRISIKRQAETANRDVKLRIYDGYIYVYSQADPLKIDLKESKLKYGKKEGITTIQIPKGGLLVLPDRVLPGPDRSTIKQYINSHKD